MLAGTIYTPITERESDRQAADDLCSDVRASSLAPCPAPEWVKPAYFDAAVAEANARIAAAFGRVA